MRRSTRLLVVGVVAALLAVGAMRTGSDSTIDGAVAAGAELVETPTAVIGRAPAASTMMRAEVGSTVWLAAIHASATDDLRKCIDDHRRSGATSSAVFC